MKNHVDILFVYGESNMHTRCKEVAHSCMWIASYVDEIGGSGVSIATVATCLLTLKNVKICGVANVHYNSKTQLQKPWFFHNED